MPDDHPVDLDRVRAALARLDRLAADHPELLHGDGGPVPPDDAEAAWIDTLEQAMNDKQVAFRLPSELVGRLDEYAEQMRRENPGMRVTRADVVRMLLSRGLARVEAPPSEAAAPGSTDQDQ